MTAAPIIIATWSFSRRGCEEAWRMLAAQEIGAAGRQIAGPKSGGHSEGGSLDAVEHVCRVAEADPEVDSVGFGGLPDATGQITLDACIMESPGRCGSVCAVERHLHVISIARRVMERTAHVMLAGPAADEFADQQGFPESILLSPEAQAKWEQWRVNPHAIDQSRDSGTDQALVQPAGRPIDRGGGRLFDADDVDARACDSDPEAESRWSGHDTISALALDAAGKLAGGCSTCGTPFKTRGRVGDSPIIGHGVYVDPEVGAVAATGTGELVMGLCSSFLAVECMRRGAAPLDALREALARIPAAFDLRAEHQVALIALTPFGQYASAALRPGYKSVIMQSGTAIIVDPAFVLLPDR